MVQFITFNTKNFDLILADLTKQDITNELQNCTELFKDNGNLIITKFYGEDVLDIAGNAKPLGFSFLDNVSKNDGQPAFANTTPKISNL